jgi:hypothetical protein
MRLSLEAVAAEKTSRVLLDEIFEKFVA